MIDLQPVSYNSIEQFNDPSRLDSKQLPNTQELSWTEISTYRVKFWSHSRAQLTLPLSYPVGSNISSAFSLSNVFVSSDQRPTKQDLNFIFTYKNATQAQISLLLVVTKLTNQFTRHVRISPFSKQNLFNFSALSHSSSCKVSTIVLSYICDADGTFFPTFKCKLVIIRTFII